MNPNQPEFWSAIIALLALILSQFPPISDLIKGAKVAIVVPEMFALSHYLGNLHINLFVDIFNTGGKTINITKIECAIKDMDTGKSWRIPARTYYSRQSYNPNQASQELFIGTVSLKPGDHWSETVHFYNLLTRTDEEKVNELMAKFRSNIFEKSRKLQQEQQPQRLIEADQHLVKEALDYFDKKYELGGEGNYQFFVAVFSDTGKLLRVRGFDFTLFKGNIESLKFATGEDYKYGAGIYYPSTNPASTVWVRIRPIDDERTKTIYLKI